MKAAPLLAVMALWVSSAAAQTTGIDSYNRAKDDVCRPQMRQAVADLGVPESQVKSINIFERVVGGSSNKRITGWTGWMRPLGVKGYLVIEVSKACSVTNIYTRGDYRIDSVDHY